MRAMHLELIKGKLSLSVWDHYVLFSTSLFFKLTGRPYTLSEKNVPNGTKKGSSANARLKPLKNL